MSTGVGERALKDLRTVRVLHPMLLSLTPLLGLYAQNANVISVSTLMRPAACLVAGSFLLWIACLIVVRDRYRAGFVASTLILSFLVLWGVLEDIISRIIPFMAFWPSRNFYISYVVVVAAALGFLLYRNRGKHDSLKSLMVALLPVAAFGFVLATLFLAPVYGRRAAWIITAYLVLTAFALIGVIRYQGDHRMVTRSANWFAGILLALYSAVIVYNYTPPSPVRPVPMLITASTDAPAGSVDTRPDIYLVALDGYARSDVLRTAYGYNNTPFEEAMRGLGFTFAGASQSNYAQPSYSLTACLNLGYLDALIPPEDRSSVSIDTLMQIYQDNRVFGFLRDQGYEVIAFSPGRQSLELRPPAVDVCLEPSRSPDEFEMVLADRTVTSRVMEAVYYLRYQNPAYWRFSFRRARILYAFDEMVRRAAEASARPRFFFVHLLIPEPPYLFTRDGGRAQPYGPGSLSIHEGFRGDESEFRSAYLDQVYFANKMLKETTEKIVRQSRRPVVIVLVSSRGAPLTRQSAEGPREQDYANLTAVRFPSLPAAIDGDVYASISMVNVFRVVFNRVFGAQLPLLEDRALEVTDDRPLDAQPVSF